MERNEIVKIFDDYLASVSPEEFYNELIEASSGIVGSWEAMGIELAYSSQVYRSRKHDEIHKESLEVNTKSVGSCENKEICIENTSGVYSIHNKSYISDLKNNCSSYCITTSEAA